jgi:hypothetical protein
MQSKSIHIRIIAIFSSLLILLPLKSKYSSLRTVLVYYKLYASHNVKAHIYTYISTYKTTGKDNVLYILMTTFKYTLTEPQNNMWMWILLATWYCRLIINLIYPYTIACYKVLVIMMLRARKVAHDLNLAVTVRWIPSAVVFNLFCSRTPRYNFSSTLYPKVGV